MVNNEMPAYIGTKMVQAKPMTRGEYNEYRGLPVPENRSAEGYLVRYDRGYESWSPKEVFEEAYRRTDGLSFGLALEAAKKGMRIARKGWNGKNQYVELGTDFQYTTCVDEKTIACHEDIGSTALVFVGNRGRQVGWLASQADMLADDWIVLDDEACWTWDNAKEAMKAGATVRRKGWEDDSWVAIMEEPAMLKGKICKVSDEDVHIEPDWEPKGEDLVAGDWYIVEV